MKLNDLSGSVVFSYIFRHITPIQMISLWLIRLLLIFRVILREWLTGLPSFFFFVLGQQFSDIFVNQHL